VVALRVEVPRVFVPLLSKARHKGAKGGRGSAKSHFFAGQIVRKAVAEPGLRAAGIREVQKSLELSSKSLICSKIEQFGLASHFNVQKDRIQAPGEGLITFHGMQDHTADSIKSLEGYKIAWVEEAQRISQRSLTLLRPTIRPPTNDGEIWYSWNPESDNDPIEQLLVGPNRIPEPRGIVVHANYYDNPWFPEDLREEMEWDRARDPEKYRHVWLGEYQRNSEARVFHNWRVAEFNTPLVDRFYYGADWGFATDPSVLVRCFIDGRNLYVDREAYAVKCEIDDTPALFAGTDTQVPPRWENRFGKPGVPGATDWPMTADSARPETISYMANRGVRIIPAR
jgi:phage terminase large subunit